MPRVYKRTTSKAKTSSKDMKDALHLIQKGKNKQELKLKEYILTCSRMFYGLPINECRCLAFEIATINKISISQRWHKDSMAGIDWMNKFRKRHPDFSLRTPEGYSLSWATSFNAHNVNILFDKLKELFARSPAFANGTWIFNLDETGTNTVQNPQKVLAKKAVKSVNKVTSAERGTLVTTCIITSASGQYLSPVIIFPRVHFKEHMLSGAPSGSLGLACKTGWMNDELFLNVMNHFIKFSYSTKENPSLLIFDNFEAHLSIAVLNLAKEHGVNVFTLPPYSTHKLQPLDMEVKGPFKTSYNAANDLWMLHNPGKIFTIYQVAASVGLAFLKTITPFNIVAALKKTGIFPYDTNVFTDIDFMCSSVTNRNFVSSNADPTTSTTRDIIKMPSPLNIDTNKLVTNDTMVDLSTSSDSFMSPKQFYEP
ncbi:uncharacterized protein LOC136076278 [Hydra vulgaris]|uniref:Uncharacterized protein LOC136076278 n=1 Tax=Hydra vulgaris TaxID=6087 RepID=A0ABM4BA88_HYDVU